MNFLLDYQIILLPKRDYWKWVRACSKYVIEFGANLTDDPGTAISYMAPGQVITFPAGEGLFPDHPDVEGWLQEAAPGVRLDPLDVKSAKELKAQLAKRLEDDDRYGQKQRPFYLLWPTDYPVITQAFGANPQIYRRFGMPGHEGLDFRALTNTNVYCCAEGTVYEVHKQPNDHPYGIHVRVRHKDGYRTVYGHLARALVSVGQFVQAGQVLGKADSTGASSAAHLHLSLERDGATARKETKYPKDVVDPTPFMVWPDRSRIKTLPSLTWPAGRCLIGGTAQQTAPLTVDDLAVVRIAELEALRVAAGETLESLAAIRKIRPGMLVMARLSADLSGDQVAPHEYAGSVSDDLKRLADAGVNYFEVCEQPNLQSGGLGQSWRTGHDFGEWFKDLLAELRGAAPTAKFGFPGLAPGADVIGCRADSDRFLADAQSAAEEADWIGVNFYLGAAELGREQALAQIMGTYRASFPNKLLFLFLDGQTGEGVGPEAKARGALSLFRRLRNEPNLGAAFGYDLLAPEQSGVGPQSTDGRFMASAEVLGRRNF